MPDILEELKEMIEKHRGVSFITCDENCFCYYIENMLHKWEQDNQDDINEAAVGLGRD